MRNEINNRFCDIEEIKRNRGWFAAFGALLLLLGGAIIATSFYMTVFSVILLGVFLAAGGVVQIIQAFLARKWSGLFLALFLGLLYLTAGFFCIINPVASAMSLTIWISALCFIIGTFKMLSSLLLRFDQWGWIFFNGLITFVLGAVIYSSWPISGLWVIGFFIGIDLILSGWSWMFLALFAGKKTKA